MNQTASRLGKMARGVKKTLTEEERVRRANQMREVGRKNKGKKKLAVK